VAETTTQIIREDPAIEAYRTQLLAQVNAFMQDQLERYNADPNAQFLPPIYEVAELDDLQKTASEMMQRGIGMYAPYVAQAGELMNKGQEGIETYGFGALGEALGAAREGQEKLSQAAGRQAMYMDQPFTYQTGAAEELGETRGRFDPRDASSYMNPYEDQVVKQALKDIQEQGDIREQGLQAQAAAAGAFGGSRQAVAEQELAKNVMEEQARTAGQLRMGGYQQASQQAQKAFEDQQARRQQAAQLLGSLGLQYGQLEQGNIGQMMDMAGASGLMGQQLGTLAGMGGQLGGQLSQQGLQSAGLGQLVQQMYGQDVKGLEAFGAREQALAQAGLDATRMNQMQMYQFPYQQLSFLSDIYKGTPGAQQSVTVTQGQEPSPFQQAAGLGIAGLSALGGAKTAGFF